MQSSDATKQSQVMLPYQTKNQFKTGDVSDATYDI